MSTFKNKYNIFAFNSHKIDSATNLFHVDYLYHFNMTYGLLLINAFFLI